MSNIDDYNALIEEINAIPESEADINLNIPVNIFVQEAKHLYVWSQEDREALERAGFN